MNADLNVDPFERLLAGVLADAAPSREPDRLVPEILRAARRERRWPRWLALIKEPPMRIHARVVVGSPTVRLAVVATATMILLLALAGAVVGAATLLPNPSPSPEPVPLGHNGLIAFDSNGDLYVSMADGSGRSQLTSGNDIELDPSWSPDGTQIAFWRWPNTSPTDSGNYLNAAMNVVFAEHPASLVLMDVDGSNARVVAPNILPEFVDLPLAWSPDGRTIAYSRKAVAETELDVVDIATTQVVAVANSGAEDPAWSPNGEWLAYTVHQVGLYLTHADGTATRPVMTSPIIASMAMADWSPDGSQIVFVKMGNTHDIWVVGADGNDPHPLVATDDDDWVANWSPTDDAISYLHKPLGATGGYALQFVNAEGQPLRSPGFIQGNPGPGAWSPDGTLFVEKTAIPGGAAQSIVALDVSSGAAIGTIEAVNNLGGISWQAAPR